MMMRSLAKTQEPRLTQREADSGVRSGILKVLQPPAAAYANR